MSMKEVTIKTNDGLQLSATLFEPEGKLKAGVLVNSATAVKQSYYKHFANFLASHGFLVVTYDYRGIGHSAISNFRDKRLTMQAWGEEDLTALINWLGEEYAQLDWHCIGHSVGGQIIGLAANNTFFKSVYCVSAQSGYWNHWESFHKLRMFAMWHAIIPGLSIALGKVPGALLGGEALPAGIARQWAYWGRHRDYIVDSTGKPIRTGFLRMSCAMKFILIDDDQEFAPPNAVKSLKSFYQNAKTEINVIKSSQYRDKAIGHFGFFRKHHKEDLWLDALEWMEHH